MFSTRMLRMIEGLAHDWRKPDERIDGLSTEIERLAHEDADAQRLMSVPGIGPIISDAMVAAIGTGAHLRKCRDFAAWLRLAWGRSKSPRPCPGLCLTACCHRWS
jgi:transposase